MGFNRIDFDLTARQMTLRSEYDSNRNEFHKFSSVISRTTYRKGDNYYMDLVVKDFRDPIRTIEYGEYEWRRDEDAARFDLISGGHV